MKSADLYAVTEPVFMAAEAARDVMEMGPLWNCLVTLDAPDLLLALAMSLPEPCFLKLESELSCDG